MGRVDEVGRLFAEGYACSQAITVAYAPVLDLDADEAARLASGFAMGMGQGQTCSAITGAVMVLGLLQCETPCGSAASRADVAAAVTELTHRFRERLGGVLCPEVIGVDLRRPEGFEEALTQGLFASRCGLAVRTSAELVEELIVRG